MRKLLLRTLCVFLAVLTGLPQGWAHENDTVYGRLPVTWPDLGHEGGTTLHTKIVTGITRLSDNQMFRWSGDVTLANAALTTVNHNFGLALSKLKVLIFEAGVQLTAAQVAAGYAIAQVDTNSFTVTNNTGSSKTIQIITLGTKLGAVGADLDPAIEVDTTGNARAEQLRSRADSGVVLNHDAAGSGADWKATIARPSSGMSADATLTLPSSTTTLVGRDTTDTLQNKTVQDSGWVGGTASSSRYIILPSASLSTLQGLARSAGKLYYATDTTLVYYDNGSVLSPVGSGSGSGLKNYVSNDGFETDTTGYATYSDAAATTPVDGTGGSPNVTIARTTTAGEILDSTASLKFTKDAANRQGQGVSYDFVMDRAYRSKGQSISVQIDASHANYVAGDMVVCLYDKDATALLPVSAATVGNCKPIPKSVGAFQATWNASTSDDYRLILHVSTTNASAYDVFIDKVTVTPIFLTDGVPISDWTSFTGSCAWSTNTTYIAKYRRVGGNIQIQYKVALSGAPNAVVLDGCVLPPTLSFDTTALSNTGTNAHLPDGVATIWDDSPGTSITSAPVWYQSSTTFKPTRDVGDGTAGSINATTPITFAANDYVQFSFTAPIAQWSGSANVVNGPKLECAVNTSTSTSANDTTSFSNDCAGAQIQNITANLTRRVRFLSAIQPLDKIIVEISADKINWFPMETAVLIGGNAVLPYQNEAGTRYGLGRKSNVNATDIDIDFGQYAANTGASFGAAGAPWSSGAGSGYWRVRKESGVASISLSEAVLGVSEGFVGVNGIKGLTDGSTPVAGYVGEYLESITAQTNVPAASGNWGDATSKSFTAGEWDMSLLCVAFANGATVTEFNIGISTSSGTGFADATIAQNFVQFAGTLPTKQPFYVPLYRKALSATTTMYAKVQAVYSVATPQVACRISGRRVK